MRRLWPLLLLLAASAAHAVDAELMKKLAGQQAAVHRWMQSGAFTATTVADELDSDGKPKKHTESVRRASLVGGERVVTVVRAIEDGKDVTAAEQRKQLEREAKLRATQEPPRSSVNSPFDADQQKKLFFWTAGSDAQTGLTRLAFRPKGARADDLVEGEAWVDAARGEAVRIAMHPSKLPTFVDKMDLELRFDAVVEGVRLLSRMDIAGEGGIAFIKRRGRAQTTFSEHVLPGTH